MTSNPNQKDSSTSSVTFKSPPSPSTLIRTKRKAKVLEEEEYVDQVAKIIGRDYFPELEKLEAQTDYLEASERNDIATMSRLRERFSTSSRVRHQRSRNSPETFETPLEDSREETLERPVDEETPKLSDTESVKSSTESKKLSLDQFMAAHTSEDNESFDEIMQESRKKFMLTHDWMFKADETKSIEDKRIQLALPSIEQQTEAPDKEVGQIKKVDGWTYKNVNAVFYPPDGAPLSAAEEIERAKKEKTIVIENTRFQKNPWKTELQNTSLQAQTFTKQEKEAGKVGVDGKEAVRPNTPSVNGFKFLRMTPSPMPGAGGDGESPFMTWGEVESTPYRLEGCDTPLPMNTSGGPSFSIQDVPKRDRIAYELAEKNSKFYRDKKEKAINKARSNIKTPKLNLTERVASMSPAAQRLATSKLGIRLGTDKALRASYTPSPMRPSSTRSTGTPSMKSSMRSKIQGSIRSRSDMGTPKTPAVPSQSDISSLTDNLLNIPESVSKSAKSESTKRLRAADFL